MRYDLDYDYARKGLASLEYGVAICIAQISEKGSVYSLFEEWDMPSVAMTTLFSNILAPSLNFQDSTDGYLLQGFCLRLNGISTKNGIVYSRLK